MSLRVVQICKETICEIKLAYNVQQVSLLDEGVGWVGNSGRDPFNQNSNRSDREKRTTSKGGPVFPKLFRLDRTDPLSFGPKFPESLVEWIAPSKFINPSVQPPPPPGPRNIAANFYLVSSQTVFLLRNRRAQYKYILQWLREAQNHLRTVESSTNPTPPHSSIS